MKGSVFCFIPAKISSSRLPEKNIKPLSGKEMMAYGIEAALNSGVFERVIVSTESEKVASVAKKYKADVPYLRKKELAKDPYGVKDVLSDFFEVLPEYTNYETVCVILPTAPLISKQDIQNAYNVFMKNEEKVLMSISPTEHNAFRSVQTDKSGRIKPIFPEFIEKRSQELESTYRINGAVIFIDIQEFVRRRTYFFYPMSSYVMPPERSIDVDSSVDFELAEFYMEKLYRTR